MKQLDNLKKVMAQQERGLLTEHEMFQEILEIAIKGMEEAALRNWEGTA